LPGSISKTKPRTPRPMAYSSAGRRSIARQACGRTNSGGMSSWEMSEASVTPDVRSVTAPFAQPEIVGRCLSGNRHWPPCRPHRRRYVRVGSDRSNG
jgi:hypothetical protein